jgi:hypothetical protein
MGENTNNETEVQKPNPVKLDVKENDIWFVDHREIYRKGFGTLDSDEKDKVLVSLLVQNGPPNLSNLTPEEAIIAKQVEHSVWKEREEFNFKRIVWIVLAVSAFVSMLAILYYASKSGVLSDSGDITPILNFVGSIYQQLFGSIPAVNK